MEPEYMTMRQAFECGDDDIPYNDDCGGFNTAKMYTKNEVTGESPKIIMNPSHGLSDQWQVIKAIPKVLTSEKWGDYMLKLEQATLTYKEIATKNELPPVRLPSLIKRVAKDSFKKGDENGWNRTKELREAVDRYIKDDDIQFHKSGIVEAMEDLKPPCQ